MTDTLMGMSPPPAPAGAGDDAEDRELSPAELASVEDLVRRARAAGIALTGPDGLLKAMTKTVVEAALGEEMAEHLGYDKGQVRNRPVYAAMGSTSTAPLDVLGMWAGDGESAKFWLAVLTELKNRGVKDVFFVICDGLKGLPDSVNAAFPPAIMQTCLIHLQPIYTAPTAADVRRAYQEFAEKSGRAYPAIKKLWDNA